MASVFFEFDYDFEASPQALWSALVDWKGHEKWIFATFVELHTPGDSTAVGSEFTAWTGPMPTTTFGQRLSLEDRMQVAELRFEDETLTGTCHVKKLGPTLGGQARFTVFPSPRGQGARLTWTEDVTVRLVPALLSPLIGRLGALGFRFFMGRLARQLRAAEPSVTRSA